LKNFLTSSSGQKRGKERERWERCPEWERGWLAIVGSKEEVPQL